MAFESVNVGAMNNAINRAKQNINNNKNKLGIVTNEDFSLYWKCNTSDIAFQKITDVNLRLEKLNNKLDACLNILSKISEYKDLQNRLKEYEINKLEGEIRSMGIGG